MSYALETSKRKFNRLLDSISNSKTSSVATAHARNASSTSLASFQPPSKRARTSESGLAGAAELGVRSHEDLSIPSVRSLRAVTPKTPQVPQRVPFTAQSGDQIEPYAPSSRQDFLLRLKTFSHRGVINWHLKPDNINEVHWAAHGWVLQSKETVRCTNCHKQIVLEFDNTNDAEGAAEADEEEEAIREEKEKALTEKYAELLNEGHDERCSWKERFCDATIYRLPVNSRPVALPALKNRYESILTLRDKLPKIRRPVALEAPGLFSMFMEESYSVQPSESTIEEEAGSERSMDEAKALAFAFAMLGWYADPQDQIKDGMVTCGACFRRLGFWMWPEMAYEDDTASEPLLCDVVEEHRPYCPWRNGATQNAGAAKYHYYDEQLPGWECLARLLKNHSGESSRPTSSRADRNTSTTATAETADALSKSSPFHSGRDADSLEHQARLGRWQKLKKTLTLPKKASTGQKS